MNFDPEAVGTVPAALPCSGGRSTVEIVDLRASAPEARGSGVGRALLSVIVAWARSAGFERMAVDFETPNLLARRFWLRSFTPVCLSFERHLDDRLADPAPESDR
jgi:GNAT superfamily N-acetyltransferase